MEPPTVSFHESNFAEWISEQASKHALKIAWGFATLLLLLFLLIRLFSGSQAKAEQDFLEADTLAPALFQPEKTVSALKKLETIVLRRPQLESEYDGLMAQAYLNTDQVEKATPLIERTVKRVESDLPSSYIENTEIALLIAQGDLPTAYSRALALKEAEKNSLSVLYYYNLFRIGMLEQALGKKEAEKKSWEEFISSYRAKERHPNFQKFIEGIDMPGASLATFIEERLKRL